MKTVKDLRGALLVLADTRYSNPWYTQDRWWLTADVLWVAQLEHRDWP